MAEQVETMVYIAEEANLTNKFQFYPRELPEEIPFPIVAKLNEIEYPGGNRTNQIIGTYWQEVEWTGLFYGTYPNGETAWDRMTDLREFVGKIVKVGFPVPGYAGFKGIFVVKEFLPRVRNYLNIEYTIKLVPHQRQEKVQPKTSANIGVKFEKATVQELHKKLEKVTEAQDVAKSLGDANRYLESIDSITKTKPSNKYMTNRD